MVWVHHKRRVGKYFYSVDFLMKDGLGKWKREENFKTCMLSVEEASMLLTIALPGNVYYITALEEMNIPRERRMLSYVPHPS